MYLSIEQIICNCLYLKCCSLQGLFCNTIIHISCFATSISTIFRYINSYYIMYDCCIRVTALLEYSWYWHFGKHYFLGIPVSFLLKIDVVVVACSRLTLAAINAVQWHKLYSSSFVYINQFYCLQWQQYVTAKLNRLSDFDILALKCQHSKKDFFKIRLVQKFSGTLKS